MQLNSNAKKCACVMIFRNKYFTHFEISRIFMYNINIQQHFQIVSNSWKNCLEYLKKSLTSARKLFLFIGTISSNSNKFESFTLQTKLMFETRRKMKSTTLKCLRKAHRFKKVTSECTLDSIQNFNAIS